MKVIYYECDGMGCKKAQEFGKCPSSGDCRLTSDINHAVNFLKVTGKDNGVIKEMFFERKQGWRDDKADNNEEYAD